MLSHGASMPTLVDDRMPHVVIVSPLGKDSTERRVSIGR